MKRELHSVFLIAILLHCADCAIASPREAYGDGASATCNDYLVTYDEYVQTGASARYKVYESWLHGYVMGLDAGTPPSEEPARFLKDGRAFPDAVARSCRELREYDLFEGAAEAYRSLPSEIDAAKEEVNFLPWTDAEPLIQTRCNDTDFFSIGRFGVLRITFKAGDGLTTITPEPDQALEKLEDCLLDRPQAKRTLPAENRNTTSDQVLYWKINPKLD